MAVLDAAALFVDIVKDKSSAASIAIKSVSQTVIFILTVKFFIFFSCFFCPKRPADAPNGMKQFYAMSVVYFFSKPADIYIYIVGTSGILIIPNLIFQLLS
jgi:hypothetical protein